MFHALLGTDEIIAIHAAAGGDAAGYNATLLDSAVQVAINLAAYGAPDLAALAAAYSWGIIRDRPFADRNDETAAAIVASFFECNGYVLTADDDSVAQSIRAVSMGEKSEAGLADWLRDNSKIN